MALSDPNFGKGQESNDWGYFSQALTMLRSLRWMEYYGYTEELKKNMEAWLSAGAMGQELDPMTGEPPMGQAPYSAAILFYLMSAKKLGYCADFE